MIEVEIEDDSWAQALPDAEALVVRAAEATIALLLPLDGGAVRPHGLTEGVAAPPSGPSGTTSPTGGEDLDITVLLTDDATLQDLNARFRGKDSPTNVLSFPAAETARPHLGDVALAFGTCEREANEQSKPLADHLTHLVAHGVLHLVGYDHEIEAEAVVMENLERDVLAGLGLPDPYADAR